MPLFLKGEDYILPIQSENILNPEQPQTHQPQQEQIQEEVPAEPQALNELLENKSRSGE